MPTIYTGGYRIPYYAGKSIGQIEAEKESYIRGAESARLALQQQQTEEARIERELARRWQQQQALMEQQKYERERATEEERYAYERETEAEKYTEEQRQKQLEFTMEQIEKASIREKREQEMRLENIKYQMISRMYPEWTEEQKVEYLTGMKPEKEEDFIKTELKKRWEGLTPEEKKKKMGVLVTEPKESPLLKELCGYQEKATKEGWVLNVDTTMPLEQQVKRARELYATKMGMRPFGGKEPSFGQQQKMAAIKSGLDRGHVIIGKEWGEPEEFDIKTKIDALRAIELGGFDPNDPYWQDVLAKYPAPKIGDIVEKGGRKYKIVDFDEDGEPLVEKAR